MTAILTPDMHPDDPPWLVYAITHMGCRELLPNGGLNPEVRRFFSATSFPPQLINLRTAWCSAFVSHCLEESGYRSTRSAAAKSYLKYGREIVKIKRGAILVFTRGASEASTGHVGFYVGDQPGTESVLVLGGNQKNCVGVQPYSRDRLMAVRWPVEKLRVIVSGSPAA